MLRYMLLAMACSVMAFALRAQFVSTTNTGLGQLESLVVDPQGNRYVCDRTGNRILKLDADNTPSVYSGSGFNLPAGMVRMPGGELYVTNHLAGTVSVIPPGGGPATVYASGFSLPRGITADAEGNLYVGEYNSQRILKVAPGGSVTVVVGNAGITGATGPSDRLEHLAMEPTGDLIATIGYSSPGRVFRISLPTGTPTLLASGPDLAGAFAINVNQSTGNIYITGVTGHRILSLTPQGGLSIVAGDGTNATLDGPLGLARFSEPSGITVDPDGNIWISQFGGAVRRIGLQPAEVPTNGLRLWLRADRGLLRNGSTVTQWLDQSGSANHATPTGGISTPQPPSFVTDVVNGYPAVRFNGVNTGLTTPAFQTFPGKRGTIFSVVRVNGPSSTGGSGYGTIAGTYYSASGTTWQFGGFIGNYSFYDGVGNANFNVASNPPNEWGIATFLRNSDNAFEFFKSGIPAGGGALANNQPSALPVHVGWNDFTSPSVREVLNGDIAELIIYDDALSPEELEQVHAYLADKYAFNGDVPLPTVEGVSICGSASATLTATGGNAYRWYDSPDATVPLATTASFTTPVIANSTTYYVANFNGQLQSQRVPVTVTVLAPGAACDDGNANTTNDVYDANCVCEGTPLASCTNYILEFQSGPGIASAVTFEVLDATGTSTVLSGNNPVPADGIGTISLCLADGCYQLRVTDAAGDGLAGYILRETGANGLRIIDNAQNMVDGVSQIGNGPSVFCLPIAADPKPIFALRDKEDFVSGQYLVCEEVAAVSAEWIEAAPNSAQDTNTGYQFWFFDPNGSYSFRRFRSHSSSDGYANIGATRACHMKVNNWNAAQHIPEDVLMNVRIRPRVNGVYGEWGPAYRFKLDPVAAACPQTKLLDFPGNPNISCDQTLAFGPGNYVYARPVTGANRYQFRFRITAEGYTRVRTSNTYILPFNWNVQPLEAGKTYDVDVRVSKDGGATWCTSGPQWGDNCTVTISGSGAQGETQNLAIDQGDGTLSMWPNPNRSEQLFLDLTGIEQGVSTVAIDIFDLAGERLVARESATSFDSAQDGGRLYTVLDLNGELAAGTYLVSITAGEERYTQRLVIAK